jgi:hypothetical protein
MCFLSRTQHCVSHPSSVALTVAALSDVKQYELVDSFTVTKLVTWLPDVIVFTVMVSPVRSERFLHTFLFLLFRISVSFALPFLISCLLSCRQPCAASPAVWNTGGTLQATVWQVRNGCTCLIANRWRQHSETHNYDVSTTFINSEDRRGISCRANFRSMYLKTLQKTFLLKFYYVQNNQPTKCTVFSLKRLYYTTTQGVFTCFSLQGTMIREP